MNTIIVIRDVVRQPSLRDAGAVGSNRENPFGTTFGIPRNLELTDNSL